MKQRRFLEKIGHFVLFFLFNFCKGLFVVFFCHCYKLAILLALDRCSASSVRLRERDLTKVAEWRDYANFFEELALPELELIRLRFD